MTLADVKHATSPGPFIATVRLPMTLQGRRVGSLNPIYVILSSKGAG